MVKRWDFGWGHSLELGVMASYAYRAVRESESLMI